MYFVLVYVFYEWENVKGFKIIYLDKPFDLLRS